MKSFNDHTGLRNKDKGWMNGSKPVEYCLHMISYIYELMKAKKNVEMFLEDVKKQKREKELLDKNGVIH